MPTYTYECKKCGAVMDVFHGMSEKRRIKCESCAGPCRRLIGSGAGIIFKGSGFYETDYKRKASPEKTSTKTDDSAKPKAKEGKKSETKTKSKDA